MRIKSVIVSSLAALVAATGALQMIGTPAEASATHENTDPYATGCMSGSWAISGGTVSIMVSPRCGTNFVLYSGIKQVTVKSGQAAGKAWTRTETDDAAKSWSLQSYAPGTTSYIGTIRVGGTTTTARCSVNCTWSSSSAPATGLAAKVDAFAARYLGRYVDHDGAYGAQCWDLYARYSVEVVGARLAVVGLAYRIWDIYDTSRYTRVSASSTPRKGDVAIWASNFPGSGGGGHVAVVTGASGSTFTALTQNPGATRIARFNKSYLRGFLRPRA